MLVLYSKYYFIKIIPKGSGMETLSIYVLMTLGLCNLLTYACTDIKLRRNNMSRTSVLKKKRHNKKKQINKLQTDEHGWLVTQT